MGKKVDSDDGEAIGHGTRLVASQFRGSKRSFTRGKNPVHAQHTGQRVGVIDQNGGAGTIIVGLQQSRKGSRCSFRFRSLFHRETGFLAPTPDKK